MAKTPRLVRYYLILAAVVLVLGGAIFTLFQNNSRSRDVLAIGESENIETGTRLNTQHYQALSDAINGDPSGLDAVFVEEFGGTTLTRLRVIADERVVFDSRNPAAAGTEIDPTEDMERAQRYQKTASTLADDKTTVTTLMPLYAPDENNGLSDHALGAIEIERDLRAADAAMRDQQGTLRWRLLVLAVFALLAIGGLVYSAEMLLVAQRQALERQNSHLMLQLISRADLSHMTVYALHDVFRKLEPALPQTPVAEGYNELEQLAKHLSLIHQLETGLLKPDKQPFPLDDLLYDRANQFKKGQVVLPNRSGLGIIADRAMIQQVVDALLNNIQEYNRRSSKVILTAVADNGVVEISAAVGVPAETERMEPLSINQRLDLTVARLITEKHGGVLGFSYDPEHGARLHTQIPNA